MKRINKSPTTALIFLVIASFIASAFPFIMSVINSSDFFYGDAQYHLRLSRYNPLESFAKADPLSMYGEKLNYTPYHALIFILSKFLPLLLSFLLVGAISGVMCILVYYALLLRLGLGVSKAFVACIVALFTPAFMHLYGTPNSDGLAIVAVLAAILIYMNTRNLIGGIISFLLFSFAVTFGFWHAFFCSMFIIVAVIIDRRRYSLALFGAYILFLALFSRFGIVSNIRPAVFPFGIFSDLGFNSGIGIFTFLLSVIGAYVLWKRRQEFWFLFLLAVTFLVSIFTFSSVGVYYLLLILGIFCSAAIFRLMEGEFELEFIRKLVIVVVLFGFTFSLFIYGSGFTKNKYEGSLLESFRWLENKPTGSVLTAPDYGFLAQNLAGKPVAYTPNPDNMSLFGYRNPLSASAALASREIKYIVIDQPMRYGLVWDRDDEGLLFALRDSTIFKKIYDKGGVEIWSVG